MRLRPISIYNVPAYQAWLEDQAAKGAFLYDFYCSFFARFESGEPRVVRYRLQPLTRGEDGPFQLGLCGRRGRRVPNLAMRRPGRTGAGNRSGGTERSV